MASTDPPAEPAAEIGRRAFEAFRADLGSPPPMTLRGGDAVDSYDTAPPYDPALDDPTDAYLEKFTFCGITYLDPASWRHYLPRLIDYSLRHLSDPATMAIEGLLWSLRPPDREPPRLASLTPEQEAVVVEFLEHVAFGEESIYERDFALQVLEEWWLPDAQYRPREEPDG